MSESELAQAIIVAASERGHRLFTNMIGTARHSKGGRVFHVKYGCGGPGSPDLWGWTSAGQFVAIEVKVPGKRPKAHQAAWMDAALTACPTLRIGWADSVEGAMEVMEGLTEARAGI